MPILLKFWTRFTGNSGSVGRRAAQFFCLAMLALQPFHQGSAAFGQAPPARTPFIIPGSAGASSLLLSPGDLIDVEVFNTPELSAPKVRIAQDGTIALPVVGNIKVAGLTPGQANAVVEQRLRDAQIMSSPSVTILVVDFTTQGFDILGEVRNPGMYPFVGTHTLYDALAAAGGMLLTNGATVTVTHHDDPTHPVVLHVTDPNFSQLQSSTLVQAGDVVEVSRADSVYVVGDVLKSGEFPMTNGKTITALDALALASGPNKTAKLGKAAILRKTSAGSAQLIPVNLFEVQKATSLDPVLLPNDILVIPRSTVRALLETTIPAITGSVFGAIVYTTLR